MKELECSFHQFPKFMQIHCQVAEHRSALGFWLFTRIENHLNHSGSLGALNLLLSNFNLVPLYHSCSWRNSVSCSVSADQCKAVLMVQQSSTALTTLTNSYLVSSLCNLDQITRLMKPGCSIVENKGLTVFLSGVFRNILFVSQRCFQTSASSLSQVTCLHQTFA